MKPPWKILQKSIVQGTVFLDTKFRFVDDQIKPKFIVVLSTKIIEGHYIICPTTSQLGTYRNSYSCFVLCNDPALGKKIIIEIERCEFAKISRLNHKYDNEDLKYKGLLSASTFEQVMTAVEESDRIKEPYKSWIMGY